MAGKLKSKPYNKHISCTPHTPIGASSLTPWLALTLLTLSLLPSPLTRTHTHSHLASLCLLSALNNSDSFFAAGRPQPRVTWWHGNTMFNSSGLGHPLSERRMGNILSLAKLKRKNLHMQLTCRAENNNLTTPIISSIVLDMNCEFYPEP